MDELIILVWTFVVISVIEFFIIIFLKSEIDHYKEKALKNWKLYMNSLDVVDFLKEKLSEKREKEMLKRIRIINNKIRK